MAGLYNRVALIADTRVRYYEQGPGVLTLSRCKRPQDGQPRAAQASAKVPQDPERGDCSGSARCGQVLLRHMCWSPGPLMMAANKVTTTLTWKERESEAQGVKSITLLSQTISRDLSSCPSALWGEHILSPSGPVGLLVMQPLPSLQGPRE